MKISENLKSRLIFLSICAMWSFAWVSAKYQVGSGITSEVGVLYRFFGIGVVSLICSLFLKQSLKISKKELKILFLYACGCASFYLVILYYAAGFVITSISAIIFSFSVIISALIKYIFRISSENILITIASFAIGVLGLFFIMLQKIIASNNSHLQIGVMLAFMATLCYSLGSLFYERKKSEIKLKPFATFFYVSVFSVSISFVLSIIKSFIIGEVVNYVPNFSIPFILSYFYLVFAGFGTMLMMLLIKRVGVVKAAYVNIVTPVFAVLISSILEDYNILTSTLIGIVLIIISNYTIIKYGKIKKPSN